MSAQKNCFNKAIVVAFVLIALVAVFFVLRHVQDKMKMDLSGFHGTLLQEPREVNQFTLTGIDGLPFTNENLKGQWTLLFFGFTHCGFVCPTTMAELAKMYQSLENKKVNPLPKVVLISVDPERDSQEKLKVYVKTFHPSFYGARGDDAVVKAMTKEMGIAYTKINIAGKPEDENYDMQHSGALILFNPKGELSAFFTTPHQAALLAKDYEMLRNIDS